MICFLISKTIVYLFIKHIYLLKSRDCKIYREAQISNLSNMMLRSVFNVNVQWVKFGIFFICRKVEVIQDIVQVEKEFKNIVTMVKTGGSKKSKRHA